MERKREIVMRTQPPKGRVSHDQVRRHGSGSDDALRSGRVERRVSGRTSLREHLGLPGKETRGCNESQMSRDK